MPAWNPQANDIFLDALEIAAPADRRAFIERTCAGDTELQGQVVSLLEASQKASSFLEIPPSAVAVQADATIDQPITEKPGTVIGPYKLLQQIGEGGFGVVYMADQTEPIKRRVALKIIKPGMDTRQVIARFEAERQALAMMDHPNIAKVLDAGTTDSGRPYFVMELVKGVPITQFCDENQLATRERLELLLPVCQALQHAHQKGIIHRDIKPSNVMVAKYDDRPVPKVIDFGVVKAIEQHLTEKTMFTQFGQIVGTVDYMSPEQANLNQLDIDTRSDIYSLGVLLYELLAGETPFDRQRLRSAAFDELLRIIREEEPPKPSLRLSTSESLPSIAANRHTEPKKLSTLVHGELDWIVMKALEKDRTRRYETANGFANDIQRYLNDEAVVACPPSAGYRFRKFARRNKVAILVASVMAASLLLGLSIATWQAIRATNAHRDTEIAREAESNQRVRAEEQRDEAQHQRQRAVVLQSDAETQERAARRSLYAAHIRLVQQSWRNEHVEHARELLKKCVPKPGHEDLRSFEWYYLWRLCHHDRATMWHPNWVYSVAFSSDSKTLASACADGAVRLWNTRAFEMRAILPAGDQAQCVAFSPDDTLLVCGTGSGDIKVWDAVNGKEITTFRAGPNRVQSVAFSPDGTTLATGSGPWWGESGAGEIKLWDVPTWRARTSLAPTKAHSLAFSPDGRILASSDNTGLWDISTAQLKTDFEYNSHAVAIFPDGKRLASTGFGRGLTVKDLAMGKDRIRVPGGDGFCLAISPDGEMIATAGRDPIVRLWDAETGEQLAALQGHTRWIWSVAFSPDGRFLASGSRDSTVKVWDLTREFHDECVQATAHTWSNIIFAMTHTPVSFSPDGKTLATGAQDRSVQLCNVATRQPGLTLNGFATAVNSLSFSPNGRLLAIATGDQEQPGEVKLYDPTNGHEWVLRDERGGIFSCLAISSDSTTLAAGEGKTVNVWDVSTGELKAALGGHAADVTSIDFSPDGTTLAAGTYEFRSHTGGHEWIRGGEVKLWDLNTNRPIDTLKSALRICCVAYCPTGQFLAAGGWNEFQAQSGGLAQLWDARTGQPLATFKGHRDGVNAVTFSHDGKTLVTASEDGTAKLWDTRSYEERLSLNWTGHKINSVEFGPNSQILITGSNDGAVKFWRAATPEEVAEEEHKAAAWRWVVLKELTIELREVGRLEDAIAHLSEAIQIKNDEPSLWRWRATCYRELGQLDCALRDLSKATKLRPDDAMLYIHRSRAHHHKGDHAEAIDYGRQAVALTRRAPDLEARWWNLVGPLSSLIWDLVRPSGCPREYYKEVSELLSEYEETTPDNPGQLISLGVLKYRLGDYESAIRALQRSLDMRIGSVDISAFQQGDGQHGVTEPGAAGFSWHRVKLEIVADSGTDGDPLFVWYLNDLEIARAKATDTERTAGGHVSIGYMDFFASIATDARFNFGLIDNLKVTGERTLEDGFDADSSADYVMQRSSEDTRVTFAFDYSVLGIPPAPHSPDGSTLGLKLEANMGEPAGPEAITFHTKETFTGDLVLEFDAWLNFVGPCAEAGRGGTEYLTAGVVGDGKTLNFIGPDDSRGSGRWIAFDGDGDATRNYRMYSGQREILSPEGFGGGIGDDNTDPYYAGRGTRCYEWLFLAMAYKQLGEDQQALDYLTKAEQYRKKYPQEGQELQLLDEAKELFEEDMRHTGREVERLLEKPEQENDAAKGEEER